GLGARCERILVGHGPRLGSARLWFFRVAALARRLLTIRQWRSLGRLSGRPLSLNHRFFLRIRRTLVAGQPLLRRSRLLGIDVGSWFWFSTRRSTFSLGFCTRFGQWIAGNVPWVTRGLGTGFSCCRFTRFRSAGFTPRDGRLQGFADSPL